MRIHIGADHAAFELAQHLITVLSSDGHEVVNHAPKSYDPEDDYPSFCISAARGTVNDSYTGTRSFGVVLGGSGNGEQISANKVDGVRAALVWNKEVAQLARTHNDANVISIGARQHTPEEAAEFVRVFIATPFSADDRHVRRIGQLSEFEATGRITT